MRVWWKRRVWVAIRKVGMAELEKQVCCSRPARGKRGPNQRGDGWIRGLVTMTEARREGTRVGAAPDGRQGSQEARHAVGGAALGAGGTGLGGRWTADGRWWMMNAGCWDAAGRSRAEPGAVAVAVQDAPARWARKNSPGRCPFARSYPTRPSADRTWPSDCHLLGGACPALAACLRACLAGSDTPTTHTTHHGRHPPSPHPTLAYSTPPFAPHGPPPVFSTQPPASMPTPRSPIAARCRDKPNALRHLVRNGASRGFILVHSCCSGLRSGRTPARLCKGAGLLFLASVSTPGQRPLVQNAASVPFVGPSAACVTQP